MITPLEAIAVGWIVAAAAFVGGWYLRGRSWLPEPEYPSWPPCRCENPDASGPWTFIADELAGSGHIEVWECPSCGKRRRLTFEHRLTQVESP